VFRGPEVELEADLEIGMLQPSGRSTGDTVVPRASGTIDEC
jgi:hypothetical protein